MTASLLLQIGTFLVATVGPFLAYNHARKLALSSNRHAWLEGLRSDIASLTALADDLTAASLTASAAREDDRIGAVNVLREKANSLQTTRHRIRLRLRPDYPLHDGLVEAIDRLVKQRADSPERLACREEVIVKAQQVLQEAWREIEGPRRSR